MDKALWAEEAKGIREYYGKFGDKVPQELLNELNKLEEIIWYSFPQYVYRLSVNRPT